MIGLTRKNAVERKAKEEEEAARRLRGYANASDISRVSRVRAYLHTRARLSRSAYREKKSFCFNTDARFYGGAASSRRQRVTMRSRQPIQPLFVNL